MIEYSKNYRNNLQKVNDTNTHTGTVIPKREWHKYSYRYCDLTKW